MDCSQSRTGPFNCSSLLYFIVLDKQVNLIKMKIDVNDKEEKMKKILILILGLLLIGVNVFAQGDLVVNGNLAVGTSDLTNRMNIVGNNESRAISATLDLSNAPALTNITAFYTTLVTQAGITLGAFDGFNGNVDFRGSGSGITLRGAKNIIVINSSLGSSTIDNSEGNTVELRKGSANTGNHTVSNYYGFYSYGTPAGGGSLSGVNWRHAYFEDFPSFGGGTVANVSGLWIDKQTSGTNNYGIVLGGDGAGADIVFGPTQSERIYSSAGRLYAEDSFGNQTILSPHDPETGEWIYYSKNIKTGKIVRVNMEKLVKAVEKLTGETFMVSK